MSNPIKTVGKFSEVNGLLKAVPGAELTDIEFILQGRKFERWYDKNKKMVAVLGMAVPALICVSTGLPPITLLSMAAQMVVPAFIPQQASHAYKAVDSVGAMAQAASGGGAFGLFSGDGAVLLHFLIIGFVTLIITTFLKFTGRGDLAPLVMFVAGGVMLLEVITLFNHIFGAVKTFLTA
jgi:hypothetical protein